MSEIQSIDFGEVSAETERVSNPGLIKQGFVNLNSIEEEALNGRKYLFLGYKGSGKSSIAERIDLSIGDKFNRFVRKISLADFPFTPFSKIIKGDAEPEAKFPAAWSWVLLIYIMESFDRDAAATHQDIERFRDAIRAFRDLGISPESAPSAIVRASSQKGFAAKAPYGLMEYNSGTSGMKSANDIYNFVDVLKKIVSSIRSPSKHYLIIDGLDEILSSRGVQYKSLYALIYEVSQLNELLAQHVVPMKVIVLCRTDLFERTPGPNKNKIRQAYAVELDWYHDPNDPSNSLLVRAANLRAKLSLGRDVDIFAEFFPKYLYKTPSLQYLLDMTRHTPRDFLQLLTYLKRFAKGSRLSEEEAKSGLREYSIKYFFPEIHDELSGYADEVEINSLFEALARLGKRDFSFNELFVELKKEAPKSVEDNVLEILKALFNCSAVGNIEYGGSETFYSFKYRNRVASLTTSKKIMIHRGLWKALNVN